MSRWWRTNRLWLAALPLCVAGAAAASSYNVKANWYDAGLHHRIAERSAHEWVEVHQEYTDPVGRTSRTYRVRLDAVGDTPLYPYWEDGTPAPPPDGLRAVVVRLDWAAAPDQQLRGCTLQLVDDDGRRFEADTSAACTPFEAGGPEAPAAGADERPTTGPEGEPDRPASWTTNPVVLVPDDAEISEVWLTWGTPDYVALRVP
jgi:hypothetical protein